MTTTDKKYMIYSALALAVFFVAWLLFVKKPKIVEQVTSKVKQITGQSPGRRRWDSLPWIPTEQSITFEGKSYRAKVKTGELNTWQKAMEGTNSEIDPPQLALLPDGRVLEWTSLWSSPGFWKDITHNPQS